MKTNGNASFRPACLPACQLDSLAWLGKKQWKVRKKMKRRQSKSEHREKDKQKKMERGKRRQKENKRESARHLQSPENASTHMTKRNRTKGNAITNIQSETLKQNIASDGAAYSSQGGGCKPVNNEKTQLASIFQGPCARFQRLLSKKEKILMI